ncbi:MAG: hypothetical protein JWN46_2876 [Acidimicrobiales bacterium]|nr:hypothetical protein [Acidimicrobiales bacterium]
MALLSGATGGQKEAMLALLPLLRAVWRALDEVAAGPARWLAAVMDEQDELWAFDALCGDDLEITTSQVA